MLVELIHWYIDPISQLKLGVLDSDLVAPTRLGSRQKLLRAHKHDILSKKMQEIAKTSIALVISGSGRAAQNSS